MNTELKISNTRGDEEMSFSVTPGNSLEEEFFNSLLKQDLEIVTIPNSTTIIVRPKQKEEL